ncbi:hypothetical protein ACJJTC_012685 [Scirpophaga incertulas]
MNQIQNKYHEYNVDVVRKDGLLLVRELAAEVKNHMDFKMNAVMSPPSSRLEINATETEEVAKWRDIATTVSAEATSALTYSVMADTAPPSALSRSPWRPAILEFF